MVDARRCRCTRCGGVLPSDQWYPVRTERDSSGDLEVHYFCSDDCASAWAGSDPD